MILLVFSFTHILLKVSQTFASKRTDSNSWKCDLAQSKVPNVSDICNLVSLSHWPGHVWGSVLNVYFKYKEGFLCVPLPELLRVLRAHTCTEPVYTLQQVVVLPVHRCASASASPYQFQIHRSAPTTEAQCHPASWPAPERLHLPASNWTRQDIFHVSRLCYLRFPGQYERLLVGATQSLALLCFASCALFVNHVSVGTIAMNNACQWQWLIIVPGDPCVLLHLSLTHGPDSKVLGWFHFG